MTNKDFQRVLTHGYVHGHIHKHKDHTHIHGHIHNHDHDQELEQQQEKSAKITELSEDLSDACRDFEELADCKDILCDELDDCFFFSCDDTKRAEGCSGDEECHTDTKTSCEEYCPSMTDSCFQPHAHETTPVPKEVSNELSTDKITTTDGTQNYQSFPTSAYTTNEPYTTDLDGICYDPHCVDNTKISYDCCASPTDTVGVLDYSRPIFENLISNVLRNLLAPENAIKLEALAEEDTELNSKSPSPEEQTRKRRKVEPDENFHQSCFHTTIPNDLQSSQLMSDFDFFIQFNNFNQANQEPTQEVRLGQGPLIPGLAALQSPSMGVPISSLGGQGLGGVQAQNLSAERQIRTITSPNDPVFKNDLHSIACQWDNCFKKVSDESLTKHIMDQHISQEYPSINPKQTSYQCEWNDCNYMNTDLNLLLNHLNVHKEPEYDSSGIPTLASQSVLTPRSTGKSSMSSPFELQTPILPSPFPQQAYQPFYQDYQQPPHHKSNSPHDHHINITQVKIIPKRKQQNSGPRDPTFACHWHMGVDSHGDAIICNKTHTSEGELQDHLCNEHIGLGKSVYYCEWNGCDRHHGKEFNQRQKLLRHIHIHTNYKPCSCPICGLTFAVDSMLKQHLRTHSGEKPFSCTICGKKFATSSSLSIHNRVHTGERPLQCKWPGCDKRFSESSNLTKHMKIHLKSFSCEVCGKEFDKKPSYTKHMKQHRESEVKQEERTLVKIET